MGTRKFFPVGSFKGCFSFDSFSSICRDRGTASALIAGVNGMSTLMKCLLESGMWGPRAGQPWGRRELSCRAGSGGSSSLRLMALSRWARFPGAARPSPGQRAAHCERQEQPAEQPQPQAAVALVSGTITSPVSSTDCLRRHLALDFPMYSKEGLVNRGGPRSPLPACFCPLFHEGLGMVLLGNLNRRDILLATWEPRRVGPLAERLVGSLLLLADCFAGYLMLSGNL